MREHTEAIRAPRALWVPFILGRPFGVPNDPAFQRRALLAALNLFEAKAGPVLEDFPEDAPDVTGGDTTGFACPVNFGGDSATDMDAWRSEISALASWHRLAMDKRARSTVALSGLAMADAAQYVFEHANGTEPPVYRAGLARGLSLRLACEDIKAYYLEAVNAQPGQRAAREAHAWFWRDTVAGRTFLKLRETGLASADATVKQFALGNLVPRAILAGLKA